MFDLQQGQTQKNNPRKEMGNENAINTQNPATVANSGLFAQYECVICVVPGGKVLTKSFFVLV